MSFNSVAPSEKLNFLKLSLNLGIKIAQVLIKKFVDFDLVQVYTLNVY